MRDISWENLEIDNVDGFNDLPEEFQNMPSEPEPEGEECWNCEGMGSLMVQDFDGCCRALECSYCGGDGVL